MPLNAYSLFPLGDSAFTLDLGPVIDEHHNIQVQAIHDWLQQHRFPGMLDVIVAYSSVSVFYDPAAVRVNGLTGTGRAGPWVRELLARAWEETVADQAAGNAGSTAGQRDRQFFRIPVCYEAAYAPDLEDVAQRQDLSVREVIELHCRGVYRVYMIGFLPGFPYLGSVSERLEIPRKLRPVPVAAGSVGIAGKQTGIYPLASPGGWSIIGRTPMKLFDPGANPPVRLQTGDRVEFYPIPADEFRTMSGRPE